MSTLRIGSTLLTLTLVVALAGCGRTPITPSDDGGSGKLKVTVQDDKGPVAGANVEVYASDGSPAGTGAQSDESGVASFDSLPPGTGYSVTAEHAGATGKASSVTIGAGRTETVTVALKVGSGPGGIIAGTVKVAGTDHPLPGAKIEVVGTKLSTVADDTGHYKIDDVPAGQQTIKASYAGYFDGVNDLAIKPGTSNSLIIQLSPQSAGERAQHTLITTNGQVVEVDQWHNVVGQTRTTQAWTAVVNRSTGNTLIADAAKNSAVEASQQGTTLKAYNATAWWKLGIGGLHSPRGASFTNSNTVLVADTGNNRVVEIDGNDTKIWEMKTRLNGPRWAVRERNGNTLIADSGNNRILEVNSSGTPTWGLGDGTINIVNQPSYVERLTNGNVLVTDSGNNRVMEVNPQGLLVWMAGGSRQVEGDTPTLNNPSCAVRLPSGNTLIADTGNNRVIEVDNKNTVVWRMAAPAPLFVDRL